MNEAKNSILDAPDVDRLVYTPYVAAAINRGSRTVFNWIQAGILPEPSKIRGQNAWRKSQIDQTLEQLTSGAV